MRHVKSERLKKLETELNDLQQWLKLGLVPKKDVEKHKEEIRAVENKILEEKERLQFLRESGEMEDYVVPKRTPTRAGYTEMPTIPDIEIGENSQQVNDSQFEIETETSEGTSSVIEEKDEGTEEGGKSDDDAEDRDEESYFSDRNRWRRGGIVDPDADEW
jgi:poly-D-alanine transfer protein DltD